MRLYRGGGFFLPAAVPDPTVGGLHVASQGAGNGPIDTCILDLKFTREELKAFDPETTPMHPFLVHSGARFQVEADYQLGRIEPPSWLNHEDIQNTQSSKC